MNLVVNSEEAKQKISNANKGKHPSEETRKLWSEQRKNPSEETRQKLSKALKGKMAGEKHPMFGKHISEEHKRKLSEANKGKIVSAETKEKHKVLKCCTKIKAFKDGVLVKEFEKWDDVCDFLNNHCKSVISNIHTSFSTKKVRYGYTWERE